MDLEEKSDTPAQYEEDVRSLLETINKFRPTFTEKEDKIKFLEELIQSSDFNALMKMHRKLHESTIKSDSVRPLCSNALTVTYDMEQHHLSESQELFGLLNSPHIHSLIYTHDEVANKDHFYSDIMIKEDEQQMQYVRIDKGKEPLGATVCSDKAGNILISRVLSGSAADKTGLLRPGDLIHEINDESIQGLCVDDVADIMQNLTGMVKFKISPAQRDVRPQRRQQQVIHVKTLFSYNPAEDIQLPCTEVGLEFKCGDILTVVNRDDAHWWQARHVDSDKPHTGLIPSPRMRERMEYAEATHKAQLTSPSKRSGGRFVEYLPIDCEGGREILSYEEVIKMEPQVFQPRPIILIAPNCQPFNMGELKSKLLRSNTRNRYGTAITHTSRPRRHNETDGETCYFVTPDELQELIDSNHCVDAGNFGQHKYCITINTVRSVIISGRVCLLTLNPKYLKRVHKNSEIKPHVIMFVPPKGQMLQRSWIQAGQILEGSLKNILKETEQLLSLYGQYFDSVVVYESAEKAFVEVQRITEKLLMEPQWVPAIWST